MAPTYEVFDAYKCYVSFCCHCKPALLYNLESSVEMIYSQMTFECLVLSDGLPVLVST